MKITLLIPTLNEIIGMKAIMPNMRREWVDQIMILDGGSTDGTIEWARDQGYDVHVQKERGLRKGYIEVMPLCRGDVVITFSPDGNSLAEKIPELVAKMREGYDMVIVSRYLDEAQSFDDDALTTFGNWFFTRVINLLFGGRYTDAMVIYRGYTKKLLADLRILEGGHSPLWDKYIGRLVSIEPLLSVRAAKFRANITEIPGSEPVRIGGVRKMMPFRTGSAVLFQIAQEFLTPRREQAS
jgi:glycosyltransferase involved in cell wall biosynthesis